MAPALILPTPAKAESPADIFYQSCTVSFSLDNNLENDFLESSDKAFFAARIVITLGTTLIKFLVIFPALPTEPNPGTKPTTSIPRFIPRFFNLSSVDKESSLKSAKVFKAVEPNPVPALTAVPYTGVKEAIKEAISAIAPAILACSAAVNPVFLGIL